MHDYWLIRMSQGNALIWKRKYFLGLIAIPWAYHGGTNIMRTQDVHTDPLKAAFEFINEMSTQATVTVELE